MRVSAAAVLSLVALLLGVVRVDAATIYAVQVANTNLVTVDTVTGAITNVGLLPVGREANDPIQGLTGTANGTLLYTDGNVLDGVWELNPANASILGSYALPIDNRGGLSFEDGTLYSVADGAPVVSQAGLGGAVNFAFANIGEIFPGALGGDDNGRLFGQGLTGSIVELNLATGAILNAFAFPLGLVPSGLAFDGTFLYMSSTSSNLLLTLNPNTGAIVQQTTYAGGSLSALASTSTSVPEPATLWLFGFGVAAVVVRRRLQR